MKKVRDVVPPGPVIKAPDPKDLRKTLDFSLEELYMIVGSIGHLKEALERTPTMAHKIKATEYGVILKKMDNAFTELHMLQNPDWNLALAK